MVVTYAVFYNNYIVTVVHVATENQIHFGIAECVDSRRIHCVILKNDCLCND